MEYCSLLPQWLILLLLQSLTNCLRAPGGAKKTISGAVDRAEKAGDSVIATTELCISAVAGGKMTTKQARAAVEAAQRVRDHSGAAPPKKRARGNWQSGSGGEHKSMPEQLMNVLAAMGDTVTERALREAKAAMELADLKERRAIAAPAPPAPATPAAPAPAALGVGVRNSVPAPDDINTLINAAFNNKVDLVAQVLQVVVSEIGFDSEDTEMFLRCSDSDLVTLGVLKMSHRRTLLAYIQQKYFS